MARTVSASATRVASAAWRWVVGDGKYDVGNEHWSLLRCECPIYIHPAAVRPPRIGRSSASICQSYRAGAGWGDRGEVSPQNSSTPPNLLHKNCKRRRQPSDMRNPITPSPNRPIPLPDCILMEAGGWPSDASRQPARRVARHRWGRDEGRIERHRSRRLPKS